MEDCEFAGFLRVAMVTEIDVSDQDLYSVHSANYFIQIYTRLYV